jgi:hypothetical protein
MQTPIRYGMPSLFFERVLLAVFLLFLRVFKVKSIVLKSPRIYYCFFCSFYTLKWFPDFVFLRTGRFTYKLYEYSYTTYSTKPMHLFPLVQFLIFSSLIFLRVLHGIPLLIAHVSIINNFQNIFQSHSFIYCLDNDYDTIAYTDDQNKTILLHPVYERSHYF